MFSYLLFLLLAGVAVGQTKRPNFVIIITDDQDVTLGGMKRMNNVHRFIGNQGVTFSNSYTTSPICCPSRASFLTGMYIHNHNTKNNSIAGGCNGNRWQRKHEKDTFATVLKAAGYSTFYAGKYLNQYGVKEAGGPEKVPPGWSEWHGLVGNSVYYNYTISNNGVPTFNEYDYLTDVIRDMAVNYIENQTTTKPFLMVLAPPAPHQPFTPAARHQGVFKNASVEKTPNFNVATSDKHWLLRLPPSPLPDPMLPYLDHVYRSRWESLLAVDEMVADVVNTLEINNMLDDTYLIYTSDNGYHIGQFAQVYDKRQPYESDIKVPLLIKGPNVPKNMTNELPVLNIDLAPTIIQLAGLEVPVKMDGRPISFSNETVLERFMLVEYNGEGSDRTVDAACPWKYDGGNLSECYPQYACKCQDSRNNTFACLRHFAVRTNKKYCLFADDENFTEMYDLQTDPYELTNIINEVFPSVKHWYRFNLVNMLKCTGAQNCDHPLGDSEISDVEEGKMKKKNKIVKKRRCPFSYVRNNFSRFTGCP